MDNFGIFTTMYQIFLKAETIIKKKYNLIRDLLGFPQVAEITLRLTYKNIDQDITLGDKIICDAINDFTVVDISRGTVTYESSYRFVVENNKYSDNMERINAIIRMYRPREVSLIKKI